MKKTKFVILTVISALIFTSCFGGISFDNLDFDKAYSFTARLEYENTSCTARFTRSARGSWEGELIEPYALQGISINYTPAEMTVSYADFAVNSDSDFTSGVNITAFVMLKVLECAFAKEDVTVSSGKNAVEITGTADNNNYILIVDKAGLPVSLEVTNKQLRVTFTEVRAENLST
ncbi:MAG: hypothetical protein FWG44_06285 [Oscillospiraceae bacterium]|nr:hypothetical protein [Oscillospiraceae bacterium]